MNIAPTLRVAAKYSPVSGLISGEPKNQAPFTNPVFTNTNAPASPASSTSPTLPGTTPATPGLTATDWAKLIQGDAGLQAAQAALGGSAAADQNALNGQFASAYESFGKPIDLSTLASQLGMSQADIQNALGPDVQRLAQENTNAGLSTTARLDEANKQAIRQITQNLNKRGLLHSGEAGYQLDQQNLGYRQAQADAYQKFLGYLQQYQQGYLAAQQQRQQTLSQAISDAANRQLQLNSPSAAAPAEAPKPSNTPVNVPTDYETLYPVPSLAAQQRGQRGSFQSLY